MKKAEIKKSILDIATDVFSDTRVLFAYFDFLPLIHNYQQTYLEQIAVQSNTKVR